MSITEIRPGSKLRIFWSLYNKTESISTTFFISAFFSKMAIFYPKWSSLSKKPVKLAVLTVFSCEDSSRFHLVSGCRVLHGGLKSGWGLFENCPHPEGGDTWVGTSGGDDKK